MANFNALCFTGPYGMLTIVDPNAVQITGHVLVDYTRRPLLDEGDHIEANVRVHFHVTNLHVVNKRMREHLERDLKELVGMYLRSVTLGCPGIEMKQARIVYR